MKITNEQITKWALGGVAVISASAFALSFDSLYHMAVNFGFKSWLAWLFPVSVDLAILVYSVALMLRRMNGLKAPWETSFLVFVTLLSIAMNAVHDCDHVILKRFVHALPPILMAMSVECLIRIMSTHSEKKEISKEKARKTIATKKLKKATA